MHIHHRAKAKVDFYRVSTLYIALVLTAILIVLFLGDGRVIHG